MKEKKFKKNKVLILIFLSIITLGIYPIIWAIRKKNEIKDLETEEQIKDEFVYGYSLIWIISLIVYLLLSLGKYPEHTNILKITGLSATVISLVFLIMVCFQIKKALETKLRYEGSTTKLSGFFTLIFSIFYLQYEINRISKRKEYQKRKGPLICAIILFGVILPLVIEITLIEVFTEIKIF